MQLSIVLKFLEVRQASLNNILAYFETVQIATVSTAGAEIANR